VFVCGNIPYNGSTKFERMGRGNDRSKGVKTNITAGTTTARDNPKRGPEGVRTEEKIKEGNH